MILQPSFTIISYLFFVCSFSFLSGPHPLSKCALPSLYLYFHLGILLSSIYYFCMYFHARLNLCNNRWIPPFFHFAWIIMGLYQSSIFLAFLCIKSSDKMNQILLKHGTLHRVDKKMPHQFNFHSWNFSWKITWNWYFAATPPCTPPRDSPSLKRHFIIQFHLIGN